MSRSLTSPSRQPSWYLLCRINRSLSSMREDFNDLCHLSVDWLYIENVNCFYVLFFLFFNSLGPSAYMRQWINHHWFRQWLVAWPAPSHYLNQCWNIVNWTPRNKLQWNVNRNSYIFIQENQLKMSSGIWRPFCLGLNVLRKLEVMG